METRVAVLAVIVREADSVAALNALCINTRALSLAGWASPAGSEGSGSSAWPWTPRRT